METKRICVMGALVLVGAALGSCGSESTGDNVNNTAACVAAEKALATLPPSDQLSPGPSQPILDSVSKALKAAGEMSDGKVGRAIDDAFNAVEDAELTLLQGKPLTAKEVAALDQASANLANSGCSP